MEINFFGEVKQLNQSSLANNDGFHSSSLEKGNAYQAY